MAKRMSAKDARAQFSEILGMVHFGKETVIVEKQGKPVVAVIDIDLYKQWAAEREARLKVFDDVRAKNRGKTPAEVEKDIAEAISEVRESARQPRGKRAQGGR
jgi:prevent-host-death family protein